MEKIKNGLIVSCQALPHEPLHSSFVMSKMAKAVIEGGAKGIRANSVSDILEIKKTIDASIPIIGIIKKEYGSCPVFITPTFKEVEELISIGVDIIAIDGTKRDRPDNISLENLVLKIKEKYPTQKIMADISTVEEAVFCEKIGFDYIGTTLVGYTEYTEGHKPLNVLKSVIENVKTKVIAEGNINTPELVAEAYSLGAYSVVVGSMITRPQLITKKFVEAINKKSDEDKNYFAVDIGGTGVKYGIINKSGNILSSGHFKTTDYDDIDNLLNKIFSIIEPKKDNISGIGISCTGKINEKTGVIVGGVPIMKNWIGTPIKEIFSERLGLPVYVNNDVKCVGLSELWQGIGNKTDNFVCIAIGTGIGGAVIDNRKLICGADNFAGEIGHMIYDFSDQGRNCKCGKKGCYEQYGSMTALIRYVKDATGLSLTGKEIFDKVLNNDTIFVEITDNWISNIAKGIANIILLLNPKTIVVGGAVSIQKELFLDKLEIEVKKYLTNEHSENIEILSATNFNNAGMLGAVYGLILKGENYDN